MDIDRDRFEILEYLENLDKYLATEFPEIAAEFSKTRNGKLTASVFHPGSNERVWWECSKCGHEWKAASRCNYEKNEVLPTEVVAGSAQKVWWKCEKGHEWMVALDHVSRRGCNCPFCTNKIILQGFNDLASVNPTLDSEWDYEKNGDMKPSAIGAGSGKKAWWICSKCGNRWQAVIHTRNKGAGCPVCFNMRKMGNQYDRKKQ
ncbi:zinc-ribbon domain-containing protein [Lachnospiraceae bacterium C1.1]|nr:zinc-ribbon domain-containing protein [Lachnospiraceae bacterium C1.1]